MFEQLVIHVFIHVIHYNFSGPVLIALVLGFSDIAKKSYPNSKHVI